MVKPLRWLALILYLALTWPLVVSDETADEGIGMALPVGLLIAGLWLLAVAFVWWLVRRLARRPRPYEQVLLALPVLLVAFLLAVMSSVGRNAAEESATAEEVASEPPGPGGADEKLERRRDAFAEWFDGMVGVMVSLRDMNRPLERVIKESKGTPEDQVVQALFDTARRRAGRLQRRVQALPDGDPTLDGVNTDFDRGARLFVAGTTDYIVGWRTGSTRLEVGDPKMRRGLRLFRRAGNEADDLYQRLGGEDAFDDRLDWERLFRYIERSS